MIIEFLTSLEKITPSTDDTQITDLQYPPCGPVEDFDPTHAPGDRFMDAGNDLLLDIDFTQGFPDDERAKGQGLPPSFIIDFVVRSLMVEYNEVDFAQALTAIDYLRDLELTRRKDLRDAAKRLCITKYNWRDVLTDNREARYVYFFLMLSSTYSVLLKMSSKLITISCRKWVQKVESEESATEQWYANIFIGLRIWVCGLNSSCCQTPNC